MEAFGKFCATIILILVSTITGGWVFMKLWSWFVSPLFNLQELSLVQALGLGIMLSFACKPMPKYDPEEKKKSFSDNVGQVLFVVITYFVILGMGWIIHLLN